MSSKGITPIKWQRFEKFLLACGCKFKHQKGSHRVYTKPELLRPIIVPAHNFDLPISVILNNLRTLGCSKEVYLEFMNKKPKAKKNR